MYITIIEDDQILATRLQRKLEKEGFFVQLYFSYTAFIESPSLKADFFLIDISLSDDNGNGFDIIKYLRAIKKLNTPIIITSAYNDKDKKVYGLNLGADDYITKVFSTEELVARIKAVSRRQGTMELSSEIIHKDINLNLTSKKLLVNGKEVHLTNNEIRIIHFFLCNINKNITKLDLTEAVWGIYDPIEVSDNTINVTISRIRKKLGKNFNLKTKINQGYILED